MRRLIVVVGLVLVAVVTVPAVLWAVSFWPSHLTEDVPACTTVASVDCLTAQARINAESDARTLVVQVAGAVVVATSALVAWVSLRLNRSALSDAQIRGAAELLASERPESVAAGAELLAQVVERDREPSRLQAARLLGAFVRSMAVPAPPQVLAPDASDVPELSGRSPALQRTLTAR